MTPFERMKMFLEKDGYKPVLTSDHSALTFKDFGVRGCFSEYDPYSHNYWQLNGNISVDNADCFNKWSQCPLTVALPETDEEAEKIMRAIRFLGTREGYEVSNVFEGVEERFGLNQAEFDENRYFLS